MLVVPALHPAFLLRSADGSRGEARFRETTIADLKRAAQYLRRAPNWDESVIWEKDATGRYKTLFPTLREVYDFIIASRGKHLACDIETSGEEPLNSRLICIGLACEDGRAVCIPILCQGGKFYWDAPSMQYLYRLLRWFFSSLEFKLVFQNGAFDTVVLRAHGLPVENFVEDTLLLHHCVDAELPHGLAYLGSRYTEIPYWKDDVKGDAGWLALDDFTLRRYNCCDALVTIRILPELIREAKFHDVYELAQEELELSKIMAKATFKGLMIDRQRRDDETIDARKELVAKDGKTKPNRNFGLPLGLGPRMRVQRDQALEVLRNIAGDVAFNPRSPIQLKKLLFEDLGFPIVRTTDKGAASTDKKAMVLLALHADKPEHKAVLSALAKYRRADKVLGTYVEGLKILGDGRVHPSWKIHGTLTGRMSSSPNSQNWSKPIKRIFRVPDGSKLVSVDLSQAELRTIAYFAKDQFLLDAYEKGLNVHTMNCTLLFGMRNPGQDTNPATEAWLEENVPKYLKVQYQSLPVKPADIWEPSRRLAKTHEFGSNYAGGDETLHENIHAERDKETDELLFPDIKLAEVEALTIRKHQLRPAIKKWWNSIFNEVRFKQHYRDPLSGRIQWYKNGFKKNEIFARPIQSYVASHMNKATIRIAERLVNETNDEALIVIQVHDALYVETPDRYVEAVKKILVEELSVLRKLFEFDANLPPDKPKVGQYLDEV